MAGWTSKLVRNVLHESIGNGKSAIFLMHGLGGTLNETRQIGTLLNAKLPDRKIINISLPLHNNAPSLHGDNIDIEWQSIDVEYMLSTLCEEYSIDNCAIVGTAFTGYPSIGFRLNNPSVVSHIVAQSWMIKINENMMNTNPKQLVQDPQYFDKFKQGMIEMFTKDAPSNVIKFVNETVGVFPAEAAYRSQQYVTNCYKQYGHPFEAFNFLYSYEKERNDACPVLFLTKKQSEENEKILLELKQKHKPNFIHKIMGETMFLTVENPQGVCDEIVQFIQGEY